MMPATNDTPSEAVVFALDNLYTIRNAITLAILRELDVLDRADAWKEDGATSLENWVSYRYAMSHESARDHVRALRAIRELPKITQAFDAGRISWDILVDLCSFVPPDEDEKWAADAQRSSARCIAICARNARQIKRREARDRVDVRELNMHWNEGLGMLRFNGQLPGAEGVAFKKAIDVLAERVGPTEDGIWDPIAQRRADALTELAKAQIGREADNATVVVHVDAHELSRIHGAAILEDGPPVAAEVARRLACDASLQVVVNDRVGNPIGIGRRSRVVPPWLMRQLKKRDNACVLCGGKWALQAHHKIHWAHGGRTDLDNLALICWKCHRRIHDQGFRLGRSHHGDPVLIRPDGTPVRKRPLPMRPDVRERMLGPPNRRR